MTDAIRWCDRRRGIGADGLIELRMLTEQNDDVPAMWAMTLWNADGSVAEVSGNGLRCVGQALAMHSGISGTCAFTIRTGAGLRGLQVEPDRRSGSHRVRVDMGRAQGGLPQSDRWVELGVDISQQIGVSLGNPHLVALTDYPESADLATIGPVVESDFPDGVNVHLVRVDNPTSITLRVWERGAGITEACGSGACAAAWATNQWGLTEAKAKVNMSGGSAEIEICPDQGQKFGSDSNSSDMGGSIFLTGPATFIGSVTLDG